MDRSLLCRLAPLVASLISLQVPYAGALPAGVNVAPAEASSLAFHARDLNARYIVQQIGDGQIQAQTSGEIISEIGDGQIQAPTATAATSSDVVGAIHASVTTSTSTKKSSTTSTKKTSTSTKKASTTTTSTKKASTTTTSSKKASTTTSSSKKSSTKAATSSDDAGPIHASVSSSVSTVILASMSSESSHTSTSYTTALVTHYSTFTTSKGSVSSTHTFTTPTSVANSDLTSLATSAKQTATSAVKSTVSGTVLTSLETAGEPSTMPFKTDISSATSTLSLVDTTTLASVKPSTTYSQTSLFATDIFQAVATGAPPTQIESSEDYPGPDQLGIEAHTGPTETNKFYANFFLGTQVGATWTHPYSVAWLNGSASSYGLGISHVERSQLTYGPNNSYADSYFVNPLGVESVILSASELGNRTVLTTDALEAFSANVNLAVSSDAAPLITFPLVQGMGFVTGVYNDATPLIQTVNAFISITYIGVAGTDNTHKYELAVNTGVTWLMYVTTTDTAYEANKFNLVTGNTQTIQGPSGFTGYIQIAKIPIGDTSSATRKRSTDANTIYDNSVGVYPTAANITGSVTGTTGTYTISWTKAGVTTKTLLMFALPHHIESLSTTTAAGTTDVLLETTTKGLATGIVADAWTLVEENLPIDMGFAPWSPSLGSVTVVSDAAVALINSIGASELSENVAAQTDLNSMYYSGKALAKFAAIVYSVWEIGGNRTLGLSGLEELESAFATFVDNDQIFPLIYDDVWGGVVSSCSYEGDGDGCDFGNSYYNDHHFHYGYFVYAAAVIGYLDPDWLTTGTNKAWVDTLVRDYANSISDDEYFPFSRMFDWYHGHSWAEGLFESFDGKNEESSSEDTMSLFAIKMWGRTTSDVNMEARGNLQLAIQARSLQHYFLYNSNNTAEPADFIDNKVSGILFENKIDHTTYFGTNIEYIQGIHMLPLMPCSSLTRTFDFVTQEWVQYFNDGRVNDIGGGWQGILYANLAIIDGKASYDWVSNATGQFNTTLLDGGASQTWYLTWAAALGGSPA